ncbi:chemotaxis protein CheW [Bacillus marinisedimentorum]|uniref:chemotaxis protein CheW n=1 Tax=Bacillus marinisedimentorum TaxID=1821260 RepID=UPI0007E125BA|nr:chemotaxis protein CheW [Bacillus marinisedimentorum]
MIDVNQESKYIIVQLGHEEFAVGISQVRSIEHVMKITAVPDASDDVMGMIHLRDEVLPVIDLRKRMAVSSPPASDGQQRLIIAILNGGNVGLLVDSGSEVLDIEKKAIQPAPPLLQSNGDYITGVARLENRLVIILDIEKLPNMGEVEQLLARAN